MFTEAQAMEFPGRRIHGPHFHLIEDRLRQLHAEACAIHPEILPSDLLPVSYRSWEERLHFEGLGLEYPQHEELRTVKYRHVAQLKEDCLKRSRALPDTIMPLGLLGIPPLSSQRYSEQGCSNACFRMLYEGVTQQNILQPAAETAVIGTYGHPLIHDEEYLKIFSTPTFRRLYSDIQVQAHTLTGVDLEILKKIAASIKNAHPEVQLFCMVNLQTSRSLTDVWHANILLGCEEGAVIVHDPSGSAGAAFKRLEKESFYGRWAVAYNRAHLLVVSKTDDV